jgi:Flp pilus assembly protein TadD
MIRTRMICISMIRANPRRRNVFREFQFMPALLIAVLLPLISAAQEKTASFDDIVSQASAAREKNDLPHAIELYAHAVQLKPDWSDGWWFLGSLQYGASDYTGARNALTHYIELTPNAGPALALRGLCEFEIADYAPSLKDIQRGIALGAANQPRHEKILRYHQALLLTRSGKFEEALRTYAYFAQDKNPNPELLVAIGLAGLRTPLLPKDIAINKQDLFAGTGQATFSFMAGDEKKARQAFQDLIQRFPTAANLHYLYGYLLFSIDPDLAVAEFKRELEVAPSNASAHFMLAWDALIRESPAEALVYAKTGMAADPTLPGAHLIFGRALLETGDVKGGIEHLEKALPLEPGNLETHMALAKGYSKSGRKDDARRERLLCLQLMKGETTSVANP